MNIFPVEGINAIQPTQASSAVRPVNESDSNINTASTPAFEEEAFLRQVVLSLQNLGVNSLTINNNFIENNSLSSNQPQLTTQQALYNFVYSLQDILGNNLFDETNTADQLAPIANGYENYIYDLYNLANNPDTISDSLRSSFNELTTLLGNDNNNLNNTSLEDFFNIMLANAPNPLFPTNNPGIVLSTQI